MVTVDEMRQREARLKMVDGWPTTLDGQELVEWVLGLLVEGDEETCRSLKRMAERIQLRDRRTGVLKSPQSRDVDWALRVLRSQKNQHSGVWQKPEYTVFEPRMSARSTTQRVVQTKLELE